MREEMKGVKEEMINRSEEAMAHGESIFEELISVKDELREPRKEIAALKPRYKFRSYEALAAAAKLWFTDRNKAIAQYGHISSWNVSSIMSMRLLFGVSSEEEDERNHWNKDFNEGLSGWDTSNVTDIAFMFRKAESFNIDLSGWNVGNCTDMSGMFNFAKSFKSDLKEWNVGNVTDMPFMFLGAESFNSDCSRWSTGNCTNMYAMFSEFSLFNRDTIKNWDLSSIKGSVIGDTNHTKEQCKP